MLRIIEYTIHNTKVVLGLLVRQDKNDSKFPFFQRSSRQRSSIIIIPREQYTPRGWGKRRRKAKRWIPINAFDRFMYYVCVIVRIAKHYTDIMGHVIVSFSIHYVEFSIYVYSEYETSSRIVTSFDVSAQVRCNTPGYYLQVLLHIRERAQACEIPIRFAHRRRNWTICTSRWIWLVSSMCEKPIPYNKNVGQLLQQYRCSTRINVPVHSGLYGTVLTTHKSSSSFRLQRRAILGLQRTLQVKKHSPYVQDSRDAQYK